MTPDTEHFVCHNKSWYIPKMDKLISLAGRYKFGVSRETVWSHIFDPYFLMEIIPGCESLDNIGEDEYSGIIRIGLVGIRGSYNTHIYTVESNPPKYCQYEGEVRGKSALITRDARINLSEDEDKCLVNYRAEGIITGALSHVNSRYIEGISQNLIKLGFRKMDRKLNSMQ